jgi:hypothetical protein
MMNKVKASTLLFIFALLVLVSSLQGVDNKFIRVISQIKTPVANNIKIDDQYVYVYNDWYLYIYSIQNLWNPLLETAYITTFPITDIQTINSNNIIVCSHEPTIEIAEIDSLNKFGRIYFAQKVICNKARREGPMLYTSHRENGLEIFDVSKGAWHQKISSFSGDWGLIDFDAKYPVVHALNDFGYVNIDITDLANPRTNGFNYEIVDGTILAVNRNIAWIGAKSTLYALDITYPEKPYIINRYRFSSEISDIKAKDNDLFVSLKSSGLKIMDISNPKNITEKNSFYFKTAINGIALQSDYIFLAVGNLGWIILEYR